MIPLKQRWINLITKYVHIFITSYSKSGWTNTLATIGYGILGLLFILFVVCLILLMVLWPLAVAWAINYLFGTSLPYSFQTWLAIFIIAWIVRLIPVTMEK